MNLRAVCIALTRNAAGKQVYLEMYQIILVLAWRMSFLYENGKTSILITWWEIISATQGQMSLCIVGTIRGYHRWVDGPLREWWTRFSKKMTWSLFLWCVRIFLQNRHITQNKTREIFLQLVYIFFWESVRWQSWNLERARQKLQNFQNFRKIFREKIPNYRSIWLNCRIKFRFSSSVLY